MIDRRILVAVSSVLLAGAGAVRASSYASMVTEVSGTITFTLNEAADDVIVIRDGTPTSLGALGVGSHSFTRSGATNYSIRVVKNSAAGFLNPSGLTSGVTGVSDNTPIAPSLQISDDNNIRNSFHAPRGLTVNTNPANGSLFGLVYIANANVNTTSGFPTPARSIGDGIYVNGADGSDPFAQGDTALTAGIDFSASASSSPYRVALDADGFVYITDWSDVSGTLHRVNSSVTTGGNMFVGTGSAGPIAPSASLNHGSVAAVFVEGTSAAGNLVVYTIDEDLTPDAPTAVKLNGLWRYNINAGPVSGNDTIPTAINLQYGQIDFVSNTFDMDRGPDGKFYITNFRSNGDEPGLFVIDAAGNAIYNSRADTIARGLDEDAGLGGTQDVLRLSQALDVSPDGQYLGIMRNNSTVWVIPLLDGMPDLPNRRVVEMFDKINSGREIAWDAAGNLYGVSSGNQALRVISPGKVSLTTLNSDGTFEYHYEPEWFVTGGGASSASGNWMLGYVPNGKSEIAVFGGSISAAATVSLDAETTLGVMKFKSANKYTIGGSSTLNLDAYGEPRVTVLAGSHDITAPTIAKQTLQLTVVPAGSTLTMSNLTMDGGSAGSLSLVKAGAGTAAVNNIRAAAAVVSKGTLKVINSGSPNSTASVSNVRKLTVAAGAKLDLGNNSMIIDYASGDPSPISDVFTMLQSGFAGGSWTGSGIVSSAAAASPGVGKTSLGYREALDVLGAGGGVFQGQTVDDTAVIVKYTYVGDTNLDGQVDITDLAALATAWQTAGKWQNGDFNYDDFVDITDLAGLATNWQVGVGAPLAMSFEQALASVGLGGVAVPEPATIGALALGATALMRRRRH